jgi:hypothetical protein
MKGTYALVATTSDVLPLGCPSNVNRTDGQLTFMHAVSKFRVFMLYRSKDMLS